MTALTDRLLADLRRVFADVDWLPTVAILRRLHELDEAPWRGQPLTARGLAELLKPAAIAPRLRRLRGPRRRGYARADFADAWRRLDAGAPVPPVPPSVPPDTSVRFPVVGDQWPTDDVDRWFDGGDRLFGPAPRRR